MIQITFSHSNQGGDIPTYDFTPEDFMKDEFPFIEEQLSLSDDKVFVCFQTIKSHELDPGVFYEREHPNFFITNDVDDAQLYFFDTVSPYIIIKNNDFNFNFFCFPNYEEAFKYCIDLKEGL